MEGVTKNRTRSFAVEEKTDTFRMDEEADGITERDLNLNNSIKKTKEAATNKKNRLKFSSHSTSLNYLKKLVPVLPLLAVTLIILIVQLNANNHIETLIRIRGLNGKKSYTFDLLSAYSREIGLELDESSLPQGVPSIR